MYAMSIRVRGFGWIEFEFLNFINLFLSIIKKKFKFLTYHCETSVWDELMCSTFTGHGLEMKFI